MAMSSCEPHHRGAAGRVPLTRRALAAVAAVLMTLPGAAYPISLTQLLRLPLEDLLRLEITAPASAAHRPSRAPITRAAPAQGRAP